MWKKSRHGIISFAGFPCGGLEKDENKISARETSLVIPSSGNELVILLPWPSDSQLQCLTFERRFSRINYSNEY